MRLTAGTRAIDPREMADLIELALSGRRPVARSIG